MKERKHEAPPRYDAAFKEGAIRLVAEEGRPMREVAEELGVCTDTIRNWLKASGIQPKETERQNRLERRQRNLEAEIRSLRKQLAQKDEVIEILKKSVGILSKQEGYWFWQEFIAEVIANHVSYTIRSGGDSYHPEMLDWTTDVWGWIVNQLEDFLEATLYYYSHTIDEYALAHYFAKLLTDDLTILFVNPDLQTVGKNNVNQINWSLYLSDFGFLKTKLIIFSTFSR